MLLETFYIILGFTILILGANLLIKGSTNIAKRFHIPEILIGLTIVALGTSAPELIVTITSANKGTGDLIIGNAVGSNLCDLLLILGLIALIKPIQIDKQAKNIHIPISLFVTVLVLIFGITSTINRTEGIILLALFIIYFSYPIIKQIKDVGASIGGLDYNINTVGARFQDRPKKKLNAKDVGAAISRPKQKNKIFVSTIYVLAGIILLKYGGDLVVDNSINIATILNINENIIGLTVIAFGTSIPELVTSIVAVIKEDENLAIGNIVGSCIFNLLLILGVGAIIMPLIIPREFILNLIILIVSTLIIWAFNFIGRKNYITRIKGIVLVTFFALYIANLLIV